MSLKKRDCYDGRSAELNCLMITEESCLKTSRNVDRQPLLCQLRHPHSDTVALFMFTDGFKRVHEVFVFDEDGHRSWFIGNSVLAGGRLVVTSAVDPVFLILQYLIKATDSGRFMSLDTLLDDAEFPECRHLVSCCASQDLSNVADIRQSDDDVMAYRYNEEKTLSWLTLKADEVVSALQQRDVKVSSSSAGRSTFVDGAANRQLAASGDYMKYAHGLIADYLPANLGKQLATSLGIKDDKDDTYADDEPPACKRSKADQQDVAVPLEDYTVYASASAHDNNKNVKLTAAQKQLSKVNKTGIKSISSFFTRTAATPKS